MKKQEHITKCGQAACLQILEKAADQSSKPGGHLADCPDCAQAAKALEADLAALHKAALRHTPPMPGPVRLPLAATPNRPFWALGFKPALALAASFVLVLGLAVGMGLLKTSSPPAVENLGAPVVAKLAADEGNDLESWGYPLRQGYTLDEEHLFLAGETDLASNIENGDEASFFEDFLDFIAPLAEGESFFEGGISQKETSHV